MNVIVFQTQIIVLECPCAQTCRLRPPLDDLAERLRREMRHGRDYDRGPTDPLVATGALAGYCGSFQHR